LAVASRLARRSERTNFAGADVLSLIDRCLLLKQERFSYRISKTTAVRFFDEPSGFSTRGVLKVRHKTIFWHYSFL
jgi:hypothetical protein